MLIVLNNKQMLITKKPKRKMIKEIIEEILQAIEDSFVTIAKDDHISYILYGAGEVASPFSSASKTSPLTLTLRMIWFGLEETYTAMDLSKWPDPI